MIKLIEKKKNNRVRIEIYLRSLLFVNLISYIITVYIFRTPNFIFTNQFTVKYVILAVVIAIINPAIEKVNNTNRIFTAMDMCPTILASIGAKIEGEKIGLGTNLYSGIPTLAEEYGISYLNEELAKNSRFYNKKILGDDYYIMKKNTQKESEVNNEENINNNTNVL